MREINASGTPKQQQLSQVLGSGHYSVCVTYPGRPVIQGLPPGIGNEELQISPIS